jgi:hypothetical protein
MAKSLSVLVHASWLDSSLEPGNFMSAFKSWVSTLYWDTFTHASNLDSATPDHHTSNFVENQEVYIY